MKNLEKTQKRCGLVERISRMFCILITVCHSFVSLSLSLSASFPSSLTSDIDCVHKELAALIKKHSKNVQISDKKQKEVAAREVEEKAIKLGKTLRGEVG